MSLQHKLTILALAALSVVFYITYDGSPKETDYFKRVSAQGRDVRDGR